jgi:hypothetical protein
MSLASRVRKSEEVEALKTVQNLVVSWKKQYYAWQKLKANLFVVDEDSMVP